MTFRMRGHEEASGTKYIPKILMEKWGKLDPVENYEAFLRKEKVISQSDIERFKKTEDTHVYCLTCKEHCKTDHSDEATCMQMLCCLLLLPVGLCCIPCCVDGCASQYHKCDSCGTLLYSAKPCEQTTSQYGDL